jgi:cytochrome b
MNTELATTKIRVWDLPLRLFHWSLLTCVIGAFVSVKIGGDAMRWHFYFGYAILTLMMFRIVWGFVGSRYARFATFEPNPAAAWRTLRGTVASSFGHNPAGALSVYAFLLSLSFQALSGLFSNDDIASEGPWVIKVSKELSDQITGWHKLNEKILIALVVLHLAAIAYYHFVKKEHLEGPTQSLAAVDDTSTRLRGLLVLGICVVVVCLVVNVR